MIPFDFQYIKPTTIQEAIDAYQSATSAGNSVIYISGGTEFITHARVNQLYADVVIDLKGIPECHTQERQGEKLMLGSAVTLNQLGQSKEFPLLSKTVKHIADHTSRNKITLGGNLLSRFVYRESVLPLFVSDCKLRIAGTEGERTVALDEAFQETLKLQPGEFLVQVILDGVSGSEPHFHMKKTKQLKVDYPVVSLVAQKAGHQIRMAFSGVCAFPFHLDAIDEIVSERGAGIEDRINKVVSQLPSAILHDLQASAGYREFVLRNVLRDAMKAMEGAVS